MSLRKRSRVEFQVQGDASNLYFLWLGVQTIRMIIRVITILLSSWILVSCSSGQKAVSVAKRHREPAASEYFDYYADFKNPLQAESSNCDEFFKILNSSKPPPQTILKALQLFKSKKPTFFNNYTLMPKSLSIHGSSYLHPRALVFGGDAKLILTFNDGGSPNSANLRPKGYESLEVMCFNSKTSEFEFRDITFPKEAVERVEDLSPREMKMPFVISKVNGR